MEIKSCLLPFLAVWYWTIYLTSFSPSFLSLLFSQYVASLLWPHGLGPTRLLCSWGFLGRNTGVGCHFLFQGIFLIQGSNLHLLHWQADSLPLSHQRIPNILIHRMSKSARDFTVFSKWSVSNTLPSPNLIDLWMYWKENITYNNHRLKNKQAWE